MLRCEGCDRDLADDRTGEDGCIACGSTARSAVSDPSAGAFPRSAIERALQQTALRERYEIRGQLGQGGMGAVFEACDRKFGRRVAIKVILDASPAMRARFAREAQILRRLSHPCLLSMFESAVFEDTPVIVTELLEGRTLKTELAATGRLEPVRAMQVVGQVLEALEVAHAAGIVHRDIKSDNVFVLRSGAVKVLDFGIARQVDDGAEHPTQLTASGQILGTPAYMAPEQCQGRPADARTDIYATGVVLFELLTGRMPFRGAYLMDLLFRHIHEAPPRLDALVPGLPVSLQDVVATALAKEPADRFPTAREFREALERAVPPAPGLVVGPVARAAGPGYREPDAPPGRRRVGRGALMFALLAGAAGLAIALRVASPRSARARAVPTPVSAPADPRLIRRSGSDF